MIRPRRVVVAATVDTRDRLRAHAVALDTTITDLVAALARAPRRLVLDLYRDYGPAGAGDRAGPSGVPAPRPGP